MSTQTEIAPTLEQEQATEQQEQPAAQAERSPVKSTISACMSSDELRALFQAQRSQHDGAGNRMFEM
jgi:hypothetical protein